MKIAPLTTLAIASLIALPSTMASAQSVRDSIARQRVDPHVGQVHEGSYNGVAFSIYHDGSAGFGHPGRNPETGWSLGCEADSMSDKRQCRINYGYTGYLTIYKYHNGATELQVGDDHYPGTPVRIRINRGEVHSTGAPGWKGNLARQIIAEMLPGGEAIIRYSEWPYEGYEEETLDLFGFDVAWMYVNEYLRGDFSDLLD